MTYRSKIKTETEPCGSCRQPVVLGKWTVRSRHSGKPLCDRCSVTGSPLEDVARGARWAALSGTAARSGSGYAPLGSQALTEQLAASAARSRIDATLARWDEHREEREAYERWQAAGGSSEDFFRSWDSGDWEERLVDLDRSGAEVRRVDPDGSRVYGEDPTGYYPPGRQYEARFWVDGPGEGAVSRVYSVTGGVR